MALFSWGKRSTGTSDPKALRAQAQQALTSNKPKVAVALYSELEQLEPHEAEWPRRVAECHRALGNKDAQIEALMRAAERYAKAGFLVKAVAMCKVILNVDPAHTETQRRLTEFQGTPPAAPAAAGLTRPASLSARAREPAGPDEPAGPAGPDEPAGPAGPAGPDKPVAKPPSPAPAPAPEPKVPESVSPPSWQTAAPEVAEFGSLKSEPPEIDIDEEPLSLADLELELELDVPAPPPTPASPAQIPQTQPPMPRAQTPPPAAHTIPSIPPGGALEDVKLSTLMRDARPMMKRGKPSGMYEIRLDSALLPARGPATSPPIAEATPEPALSGEKEQTAREVFAATPIFSELSPTGLERLIATVQWKALEPDTIVFRQGDPADALYVISEGEVVILCEGAKAQELGRLREGEFFGEIGLISRHPRHATVRTVTHTELLVIDPQVVCDLVDHEPEAMKVMLRFVRDRLVDTLTQTHALFEPFSREERLALASRFLFLEIDEGSLLIEQGQPVEGLYVLLSGSADVLQSESDGEELLAQLQAGDLLGESALLSGTPAPETVRAATKAYALMMPAADFRKTVMAHPHVLDYVSTVAASKALVSQGLVEPAEQNAQYYDWHLDLL